MDTGPNGGASRSSASDNDVTKDAAFNSTICPTGAATSLTSQEAIGSYAERGSSREPNDTGFFETSVAGNSTMVLRESQLEREGRMLGHPQPLMKSACMADDEGHIKTQRELELLRQRREVLSMELELAKTNLLLFQLQSAEKPNTTVNARNDTIALSPTHARIGNNSC